MNTTQLECFMEVANYLNFSRAAEHLRLTQPAVSHQINTLEDELGVRLFHRTSKSVRLTQEGYLFIQYAGEILKLSGLSKARIRQAQRSVSKRLVIGCRSTAELRMIRPALTQLRKEDPSVIPVLRLIPSDSLENLLAEGNIHIMFSFQRKAPPKMRRRELTCCPPVCVCSQDHPLAGFSSLTEEQLRSAGPIAVYRPPACPPELFAVQSKIVSERHPDQMFFCDSQEAICTLAVTGYAFALLLDFPHARLPGLTYIPLSQFDPIPFSAVYAGQEQNPVLRQFLDLLAQSMVQPSP